MRYHHAYSALAAALWTSSLVPLVDSRTHRTVVAAASTLTIMAWVDRRASDRDTLIRLGLWTGAASQLKRCTNVHETAADFGTVTESDLGSTPTAVDSEAWQPPGHDD